MKRCQLWITAVFVGYCCTISISQSLADHPPNVSYCDLLSEPQKYDRRIVATKALVQSSYHAVHVYDFKCRSTVADDRSGSLELPEGWNSTKLGKQLAKILRHDRTARVSFEADFYDRGGPFGPEATRFRFVMKRIISVEEVPRPPSEALH